MVSWLKTIHLLFKWCRQLKAVFIAVYWLHVLGNFIYIVKVKMAMGNSAKQQWASLNIRHFLSNNYLFVDFIANTLLFISGQVKYSRLKINFGSD